MVKKRSRVLWATLIFKIDILTFVVAYCKVGLGTRTDRALTMADEKLFTPEAGDRTDAPNVAIVMTDGKTRRPHSDPFTKVVPPLRVSHSFNFHCLIGHLHDGVI